MASFEVHDLGVWIPGPGLVAANISFRLEAGSIGLLTGGNGAGASRLLDGICGQLSPGMRRVGQILVDDVDLTSACVDDIAMFIRYVAEQAPADSLKLEDLWLLNPATIAAEVNPLVKALGLQKISHTQVRESTSSMICRAKLVAALVSPAPVLILDQVFSQVESSWQPVIQTLIADFVKQGNIVLLADQCLDRCLTLADVVIDIADGGRMSPAWAWQPKTGPLPALAFVASAIGQRTPQTQSVEGLHEQVSQLLPPFIHLPDNKKSGGIPVAEIQVSDNVCLSIRAEQSPMLLFDSQEEMTQAVQEISGRNDIPVLQIENRSTVFSACKQVAKLAEMHIAQVTDYLYSWIPRLRIKARFDQHSSGEQQLLKNLLTLLVPAPRLLVEPYRKLDLIHLMKLAGKITETNRSAELTIVLTTDVEAMRWHNRVSYFTEGKKYADGSPGAILGKILHKPLVAQVSDPLAVVNPNILVANLTGGKR